MVRGPLISSNALKTIGLVARKFDIDPSLISCTNQITLKRLNFKRMQVVPNPMLLFLQCADRNSV